MNEAPSVEPTKTSSRSLDNAAQALLERYLAVQREDEVLITADLKTDRTVVDAVFNAALRCNVMASALFIPQLPYQGRLADPYTGRCLEAAAKSCDVWVDFTFPYLAGSAVHSAAMKEREIRAFLGGDLSAGGLKRFFSGIDYDALFDVQEGFDDLSVEAQGKTCRMTNDAGSDVTFVMGEMATRKHREARGPGTYTPPGSSAIYPEPDSVKGTIVIDAVFHEYYTGLSEPIVLEIDSHIREVSGGRNERMVLERALKRAAKQSFGQIIHFSYGFHPAARFTGRSFIEDIRVIGNNAIGFGVPWWSPDGGENHPDGVMTLQSLEIEGEALIELGRIVRPDSLVAAQARIEPR